MALEQVRQHYEEYPYPHYPLLASVRTADTCHLNLDAIWTYFNHTLPPAHARRILIAGCGSFSPYPFAAANPHCPIIALDLSSSSIRRAGWHCLLHGCHNVTFETGDLCDPCCATGIFGLIDAFGVLHHLDDPLAGLNALAKRLAPGGIIRVMLYSRYARREEESIRRALRMLKISDIGRVKKLLKSAPEGSRLHRYIQSSPEAGDRSGIADALLHPTVHTYLIGELLEIVTQAGLKPLRFVHHGALQKPDDEVARIRQLERSRQSPGNFVLYLGNEHTSAIAEGKSMVLLNRCLAREVSHFRFGKSRLHSPFSDDTPLVISPDERAFLRTFRHAVPWLSLSMETKNKLMLYREALFLLQYVA